MLLLKNVFTYFIKDIESQMTTVYSRKNCGGSMKDSKSIFRDWLRNASSGGKKKGQHALFVSHAQTNMNSS